MCSLELVPRDRPEVLCWLPFTLFFYSVSHFLFMLFFPNNHFFSLFFLLFIYLKKILWATLSLLSLCFQCCSASSSLQPSFPFIFFTFTDWSSATLFCCRCQMLILVSSLSPSIFPNTVLILTHHWIDERTYSDHELKSVIMVLENGCETFMVFNHHF